MHFQFESIYLISFIKFGYLLDAMEYIITTRSPESLHIPFLLPPSWKLPHSSPETVLLLQQLKLALQNSLEDLHCKRMVSLMQGLGVDTLSPRKNQYWRFFFLASAEISKRTGKGNFLKHWPATCNFLKKGGNRMLIVKEIGFTNRASWQS